MYVASVLTRNEAVADEEAPATKASNGSGMSDQILAQKSEGGLTESASIDPVFATDSQDAAGEWGEGPPDREEWERMVEAFRALREDVAENIQILNDPVLAAAAAAAAAPLEESRADRAEWDRMVEASDELAEISRIAAAARAQERAQARAQATVLLTGAGASA